MAHKNIGLETEIETYTKLFPTLKEKEGKFAVIAGEKLLGTFDTYSDALDEGYSERGLETFLVKQISSIEIILLGRDALERGRLIYSGPDSFYMLSF